MFQVLEIGPFMLWSRLVFTLAGLWIAAEFLFRLAESANLSLQHFRDKWYMYLVAFLAGGRLFAIIAEYQVYLREPLRIVIFTDGGFSFLGSAVGIGFALQHATRGHRSIFLQWLDALVPATCIGLTFAWLGSFFAGDAYGAPTDLFWGITYDAPNVRYAIPVHPVQLYFALFYFLLTFVLLVIRKRSKRVGAETLFGIICAAVGIFLLENFRGDFTIKSVFITNLDFLVLGVVFLSLGIFAAIELRISLRSMMLYFAALATTSIGYLFARPWLILDSYELRLSQFLAMLALLATIVYVVVERRKHPYF